MISSRRTWVVAGMCLLALALVSIAAGWVTPGYPQRDFSDLIVWEVASVLGPDRVLIAQGQRQRTVKLIGVAATAIDSEKGARSGYESKAQAFLVNLLTGERVYVSKLSPDSSKISSVKLFRAPDGLYVNLELVRQGYSRMDPTTLAGERKLFDIYQSRAQQAGKGLWSKRLPAEPATTLPGLTTVYITKSGKKYHLAQCQFLAKSRISINLDQSKERNFTPCKVCKPPQ